MKRPFYATLLVLFFLSGATGLVYEVAWTRMLTLVFGHTVHAVSTVLAAFMGGLALGSWIASRFADRLRRPLVVYGALEIGIALFALAVPPVFDRLDVVFGPIYRSLGEHDLVFGAARFALCFAILLVPTILMGATLPILSHAIASGGPLGARLGRLYALNTLGAVTGCFLAGFALLELLGVHGSILVAALVNALVAAIAWFLGTVSLETPLSAEGGTAAAEAPRADAAESAFPAWLPFVYGASGFVALALEVAWTRALVFSFFGGNSTYAFATMLTVFLAGLGLGSLAAAAVVDRLPNRMRVMAWGEIVIGAFAFLSAPALVYLSGMHLREFAHGTWLVGTIRDVLKSATVMFVPTFAMGALFPLMARVYVGGAARAGRGVGRLYFANTAGAILGSLGAGFVLVPYLGVGRTIVALASVSVLLGAMLAASDLRATRRERQWTAIGAVVAAVAIAIATPAGAPLQMLGAGERMLFYKEGPAATVAVVETATKERRLQIDNVWVAGTTPVMKTAHKTLAHVGALLHPDPKKVLAVGFASGGTSWSYTLHPSLERIDCVEIDDTVLEARSFFTELNGRVTEDPRFHVTLEDARTFLLLGRAPYDLIATDCTDLRYKSDANLYTVEYFDLCRRRLSDDGMLVVFLPFGGLPEPFLKGVLATFLHTFPDGSVWYLNNYPTHYFLLVGSTRPLRVDWRSFRDRLAAPAVRDDLASIGLADPYRLLASYLGDGRTLAPSISGARLNSVDDPWVEFGAPRVDTPGPLDALDLVLGWAPPAVPSIEGMTDDERANLDRYAHATRLLLRGQVHASRKQMDQARIEYEDALTLLPADPILEKYTGVGKEARDGIESRIAANPSDLRARYDLVLLLKRRGEFDRAESLLLGLLGDETVRFPASMSLALTLEKLGRFDEAVKRYEAAASLARDDSEREVARRGLELLRGRETLRAHPEDAQGALDLAQRYARYGDLYEALRLLESRAAERSEPTVLEALAALYLQASMIERAEEAAERLVTADPGNPAAHYYLMDASIRLGKLDRAERAFEASRALDDTNPSLWFAGARLKRIRGNQAECAVALRRAVVLGGPRILRIAETDPVFLGSACVEEAARGTTGGAPGGGVR